MDIQSALATALDITGITKASPGVVTYTGTDPSNGDYVVFSVQGMRELHNRIGRVANVNAGSNTFEIEGIDTTLFGTFTSGTCQVITFGTSLNTITGVTPSGGDAEFDDQTTVHDDIRVQAPTIHSAFVVAMESIWDPSDAGLVALKAASDLKTTRCVRITFADGSKLAFVGYVSCTMLPTGAAPGKVTTALSFTSLGRPDFWAT